MSTTKLREGYAELGDVRLHYVEAGEGPLVVLLHGFPEFWYGWRQQIEPLAAAGFRVVAPDMRGYNTSSRPEEVHAYDTGPLTDDIRDLIHERGAETAMLAGHDWGGSVAWDARWSGWPSSTRPTRDEPPRERGGPAAQKPSCVRTTGTSSATSCATRPPAFTPEQTDRYIEAWSQPGAATGMINYYRSSVRTPPKQSEAALRPIKAPTLVIWGERDRYLNPDLAEPHPDDVPNLVGVERLPNASHWVHHDEADRVIQLLTGFCRAMTANSTSATV